MTSEDAFTRAAFGSGQVVVTTALGADALQDSGAGAAGEEGAAQEAAAAGSGSEEEAPEVPPVSPPVAARGAGSKGVVPLGRRIRAAYAR